MNPPSTIGRHELSQRFTANVKILNMDYPKLDSLKHVYQIYLKKSPSSTKVSAFLVDLYSSLKKNFSIDE